MRCAKSWMRLAVCGALVVVGSAVTASAQPGAGGRGGFGGGGGNATTLLLNENVQKELELVDDQKAAIKKLGEESTASLRDTFSGLRDLSREERQKKMEELRGKVEQAAADTKKKVDEILLPQQRDRLKEISIQARGTRALSDKEVAEALKLTDDQKAQIAKLNEENAPGRGGRGAGGAGGAGGGGAEAREKARAERREKYLAVLTSDQKAQFEKMAGKKVSFDLNAPQGRGQGGQQRRAAGNRTT